jgi:hypothetical protein
MQSRADVLTYDSDILQHDLTIAGDAAARMFVSCDCKDFDLWVRLLDVHPDGRAINLRGPGAAVLRASYRNPDKGRQTLQPGNIVELYLDDLMTANTFKAGHRMRVQIFASFSPHLSLNLQSGESEIESSAAQVAQITIYHDPENSSLLELPILAETE